MGVVGLGAGGLACYGGPGQSWHFFEIDPLVAEIARDPRYFTFLRDCPPRSEVVLGDGRLTAAPATVRRRIARRLFDQSTAIAAISASPTRGCNRSTSGSLVSGRGHE